MRLTTLFACILIVFICGCGSSEDPGKKTSTSDAGVDMAGSDLGVDASADAEDSSVPESACIESVEPFGPGTTAFVDRSEEAGFASINPVAVRISVADVNANGWPDLVVRRVGDAPNSFAEDGQRTVWLLENQGDGTFDDVTRESALTRSRYAVDDEVSRPGEVIIWADVDNDGTLDALTAFSSDGALADGSEIMSNDGEGTFSPYGPMLEFHRRQEAVRIGGASFVDFDRDGRIDLWLTHGFIDGGSAQDRLYRQAEDGSFVDVTEESGLLTEEWTDVETLNSAEAHTNSWGSLAADLDGDGTPELLSASYGRAPNHLWKSSGDGWTNASVASGYAFDDKQDWTQSHSARCYCQSNPDSDGCDAAPDPVFTCDFTRGWVHERDTQPFRLGGNSGTTAAGDVNSDGVLDLLTSEIVHFDVGENSDPSELLINDGNATFMRPGNGTTGLERPRPSMQWDDGDITAALVDFDNDGRLDVLINSTDYPGTRVWLWHQQPDATFNRVDIADGIDHTSSHGIGIADFDRDGDLDIVLGHSAARCSSGDHCYPSGERHVRYFENQIGNRSNWIQIDLEGAVGTNRAAIGAQITVRYPDGRVRVHEIDGGHGHYGIQHDRIAHFGLGEACKVEVTVRWPDQDLTTETHSLTAGYRWDWKQGETPSAQTAP